MISLILPYWDRQAAANRALGLIAKQYADLDLEVVVVDDGNPKPFQLPPVVPKNLLVLRLPEKCEPLSPVTAWNYGVSKASGDIVVLSCIEVLHEKPVLEQMATELELVGPDGYILAAAWCPDTRQWHCHSRHTAAGSFQIPEGTGRSFCSMLHRSLYERTGGFDEEYRMGAGYEDVDFIYRLIDAGAKFSMRDDLIVTHPKEGASIRWGAEKFARNQALLREKWPC